MDVVLDVRNLKKSYPTGFLHTGRRVVVADLSFDVHKGEIFGYLGPNGSGKTTTLKAVMGLVSIDSGSITVLGHPLSDHVWRRRIGFLPENPYFYDYLSASEYLDYVGRLFGMSKASRRERTRYLLELVGLAPYGHLQLRRYSKGMVQRLGIAQALVNDPELVFLDEPMSGLDPIGRHLVRELIQDLQKAGKTIVFSTHILSDAETLCHRVAVIRGGELLRVGRIDEILRLDVSHVDVLATGLPLEWSPPSGVPIGRSERIGERQRLEVAEGSLGTVVVAIEGAGGRVLEVHPVRQSLEEYFFKEMGGDRRVNAWEQPA
jgi:ABC-2 type transport system ATP-binding protein